MIDELRYGVAVWRPLPFDDTRESMLLEWESEQSTECLESICTISSGVVAL